MSQNISSRLLSFKKQNSSFTNIKLPSISRINLQNCSTEHSISNYNFQPNQSLSKIIKQIYTNMEEKKKFSIPQQTAQQLQPYQILVRNYYKISLYKNEKKEKKSKNNLLSKFYSKLTKSNRTSQFSKSPLSKILESPNSYKFDQGSRKLNSLKSILNKPELTKQSFYSKLASPLQNQNRIVHSSKVSKLSFGVIQTFAANTHNGNSKTFNEDRVSIVYNLLPQSETKSSFFAIFDGHGGAGCADFLKDNLYKYDPKTALIESCQKAEQLFLKETCNPDKKLPDFSGSCGIIILIVERICYVANIGDSRAIMSTNHGKKCYELSRDHKPQLKMESERIIQNGGKFYKNSLPITPLNNNKSLQKIKFIQGPIRIWPGTLNVSRSFGDLQSKDELYGGKQNIIISEPEIKQFYIDDINHDFIFLGCDGIFDKLKNTEIINLIWREAYKQQEQQTNLHEITGKTISSIIKEALELKATDNLTAVIITFNPFVNSLQKREAISNRKLFCYEQVEFEKEIN